MRLFDRRPLLIWSLAALAAVGAVPLLFPNAAEERYYRGIEAVLRGDETSAREEFKACSGLGMRDCSALLSLAEKSASAPKELNEAIGLPVEFPVKGMISREATPPATPSDFARVARKYSLFGDRSKALELARVALELDPCEGSAYRWYKLLLARDLKSLPVDNATGSRAWVRYTAFDAAAKACRPARQPP